MQKWNDSQSISINPMMKKMVHSREKMVRKETCLRCSAVPCFFKLHCFSNLPSSFSNECLKEANEWLIKILYDEFQFRPFKLWTYNRQHNFSFLAKITPKNSFVSTTDYCCNWNFFLFFSRQKWISRQWEGGSRGFCAEKKFLRKSSNYWWLGLTDLEKAQFCTN